MANIIKNVGSAVAKNKEDAKAILDKYKISYGAGKTSDLILASFKAIKDGNKDLATDLVGLVEKNKSVSMNPSDKAAIDKSIQDRIQAIKDKIKTALAGLKLGIANGERSMSTSDQRIVASNADGNVDPIESGTTELVDAVNAASPESLLGEALSGADMKTSLIVVAVTFAVIAGILYWMRKK